MEANLRSKMPVQGLSVWLTTRPGGRSGEAGLMARR